MILTWNRVIAGKIRSISSVSALALNARTTSPSAIMPKSPWSALDESSTTAGEPVLVSVEAIFAPMCPDLPTPTTTTFPRASTDSLINSTAREKFSSSRFRSRWSSKISKSRTRAAFSRESIERYIVLRHDYGQHFVCRERKGNMKTLMIAILAALVTTASAQEFRARIGAEPPVRAIETPPPVAVPPKIEGALPRAFGQGRNPLQVLNPWAPARYGIWVENAPFDPSHPGKWNGIK